MARTGVRLRRSGIRYGRLALTAALALSAATVAGRAAANTEDPVPTRRHVVAPGDTLWAIASTEVGPTGDPRPVVQAIRDANQLATSAIQPGQILVVPATAP